MDLETLPTPALVLDRGRLRHNAERMKARAASLGVALRPHLKTTKSRAIARIAESGGGATVSTLREAEYFARAGSRDLVWAVCATPDKLDRAAALVDQGADLLLLTDDLEVARAIAAHPVKLRALVEIDCGGRRTGLAPSDPALIAVGRALGERLAGVLTHAGHSYDCRDAAAIAAVAEQERAAAVEAAERLAAAGCAAPIVSVGSTPTAVHAAHLDGVTEMRPGVYLLGDLFQAAIGTCRTEEIALSVLATVIHRSPGRAVIDAGGLALSKDRSTAATGTDAGYGLVCDIEGTPLGGARVDEVHQEHGLISDPPQWLSVGSRVRILPNHACMTAAAHDRYHVIDEACAVVDTWDRDNGW